MCSSPFIAAGTNLQGRHSLCLPSDLRRATGRLPGAVPGGRMAPCVLLALLAAAPFRLFIARLSKEMRLL